MKTNESERSIHESRYLVSLMKLRAKEAAIICSTIEIMRATSLTIMDELLYYKCKNIHGSGISPDEGIA